MANSQRKLSAVPTGLPREVVRSRQEKALGKIAKHKKKNKLGTYSDPAVRQPVLNTIEVSRTATKLVEIPPPVSLWTRIKQRLSK